MSDEKIKAIIADIESSKEANDIVAFNKCREGKYEFSRILLVKNTYAKALDRAIELCKKHLEKKE